jgi:hypothetical protein
VIVCGINDSLVKVGQIGGDSSGSRARFLLR